MAGRSGTHGGTRRTLSALSSISGNVIANEGDAVLWAGGGVTNTTSATHDVVITAWGPHSGSALAGNSMYVFAGEGGRSVLNAGLDLVYLSWGSRATIFADAG